MQAYRVVDPDVSAAGVIKSTLVQPGLAAEDPYQPSASVAFGGSITGTINGASDRNTAVTNSVEAGTTITSGGITMSGTSVISAGKTSLSDTAGGFWLSASGLNVSGNITGTGIQGSSFTTTGSYLTTATTGAETTIYVFDTSDFATSGSGWILDSTNDRDAFSWTGKTATTLTGCSGVLAHAVDALVIPQAKQILISEQLNEQRFFGDRGDGTVSELATIGIKTVGSDNYIGYFGSADSSHIGIGAITSANFLPAVLGTTVAAYGIGIRGTGSASGSTGVNGINTDGTGVAGSSANGYGGYFASTTGLSVYIEQLNDSRGAMQIRPKSNTTDPTAGARGEFYVRSDGVLRFHDGTSWRTVNVT